MKRPNEMQDEIDTKLSSESEKCNLKPVTMNDVYTTYGSGMCGRTARMCMKSLQRQRAEEYQQCVSTLMKKPTNLTFSQQSDYTSHSSFSGFKCHMGLNTGAKPVNENPKYTASPKM
jgi:hypothetical protein